MTYPSYNNEKLRRNSGNEEIVQPEVVFVKDRRSGENPSNRKPKGSEMENHLQSGIALIILALITWVGVTMQDLQKSNIKLSTKFGDMQEDTNELKVEFKQAVNLNYTKEDAVFDRKIITDRLQLVEKKVNRMERDFDRILLEHNKNTRKEH